MNDLVINGFGAFIDDSCTFKNVTHAIKKHFKVSTYIIADNKDIGQVLFFKVTNISFCSIGKKFKKLKKDFPDCHFFPVPLSDSKTNGFVVMMKDNNEIKVESVRLATATMNAITKGMEAISG